jgi:putative nucleotide binding protein
MGKDEYAYVLEYLPYGTSDSRDRHPSAIILTESLSLLVAALKKDVKVEAGKKVYIGENKRDEIHHIIERTTPDKLTESAREILKEMVHKAVQENEKKYIGIMNTLGPINVRLHALELIPGLGKKLTQRLLEERKKKPFESYAELDERLQLSSNVVREIEARIMEEIENRDKYKIFT